MFIGRSTQDKQGDRHERRANQRTNESIFRGWRTRNYNDGQIGLMFIPILIGAGFSLLFTPQEEGVEHAVDEHDVHTHEVEDGFGEDHGDRADETGADDIVQSEFVFLLLGDDVGVSGLFAETSGAAFQDHGGVGLWDETDVIGPIVCGWITVGSHRLDLFFWTNMAFCGAIMILVGLIPETYAPVILKTVIQPQTMGPMTGPQ
jgi:hypothetical protein